MEKFLYRSISSRMLFLLFFIATSGPAHAAMVISSEQSKNVDCNGGSCTAKAEDAVLNIDTLTVLLASGNVDVDAGDIAKNIVVNKAFGWTSNYRLRLAAPDGIYVDASISVAGGGAVDLESGGTESGENLSFSQTGSLSFLSLSNLLLVDGRKFKLVGDVSSLAQAVLANAHGRYALAHNYDAGPDGTYPQAPVQTFFYGIFEGLGNAISNLTISGAPQQNPMDLGLFSGTANTAILRDIALVKPNITDPDTSGQSSPFLGALVGDNGGKIMGARIFNLREGASFATMGGLAGRSLGLISDCAADGKIKGDAAGGGGLVGGNYAKILRSHAAVDLSGRTVSGSPPVFGGLAGGNSGLIEQSSASGSIKGGTGSIAGGLVGRDFEGAKIVNSSASASIKIEEDGTAGGLVGDAIDDTQISQSYATGSVSGNSVIVGGFAGSNSGDITNSYSEVAVTGRFRQSTFSTVGGLASYNFGSVKNSYVAGRVKGRAENAGGVFGYDEPQSYSHVKNNYWDTTTTGIHDKSRGSGNIPNDPGTAALSDKHLKASLPPGFSSSVWAQNPAINGGLPYLIDNPPTQ